MTKVASVRARSHHGASGLDLTVPASLCKLHSLHLGDLFVVNADSDGRGGVTLSYRRVHAAGR